MGIEIKNAEVIIRAVKERLEAQKREFREAISDATLEIVDRTRKGKDVDGNAFAPYSPKYAKYKTKLGRNISPPDLTFTGNMLAAIQHKFEESDTKLVGIIDVNSALEGPKAHGNMRYRNFFGLSDEQVREIKERVNDAK